MKSTWDAGQADAMNGGAGPLARGTIPPSGYFDLGQGAPQRPAHNSGRDAIEAAGVSAMSSSTQVTVAVAIVLVLGIAAYMYLGGRAPAPVTTQPAATQQTQ
jgi:hypothetical protein